MNRPFRLSAGATLVAVLLLAGPTSPYQLSADSPILRGLIPRIRLFCAPCFDRYAQELWVRSLWWNDTPRDDRWYRARGAMYVPAIPESLTDDMLELKINGTSFDPATVYVFLEGEWVNLAWSIGLPTSRALPSIPPYIPVQAAPIPGEPRGDWGR